MKSLHDALCFNDIQIVYVPLKGFDSGAYNLINQNVYRKIYQEYYKEYGDFWRDY